MGMTDREIEEFEAELEEQRSRNYEFWSDYQEEKYYTENGGSGDDD